MTAPPTISIGMPADPAVRKRLYRAAEAYAAAHGLVPPLSMEELRDHAERMATDGSRVDYLMVLLNNAVWKDTVASIPYTRRLLLLPQCLRPVGECPARVDAYGLFCEGCGRCAIGSLQALAEDLGYVVLIAEGSTIVSRLLQSGKIDAVVGVSCLQALEKSFPYMADGAIPGLAIPLTVDGCRDTETDMDLVREAIALKTAKPWRNQLDSAALRRIVATWFTPSALGDPESETAAIAQEWLLEGGKRWRPFLLACTYSALKNGTQELPEDVRCLAMAAECFHKASLIHDDIEDGDELRYGRPVPHRRYGIPVAINVGDWLVGEGYRWIGRIERRTSDLLRLAAENHGMLCLGQGAELLALARGRPLDTAEVLEIFRRKTAPAFRVALQMGALAADAEDDVMTMLGTFSDSLGIAYQIRDDLDDFNADTAGDPRASLLTALAREHGPLPEEADAAGRSELTRQWRNRFIELMVAEQAARLLEHYKHQAIRALNPLRHALLKSLLRRLTAKMLLGSPLPDPHTS